MANTTDCKLRNQVIYSVYLRNHTAEGTFRALIPDLDRIRALGADILWLMPIHPIGIQNHKGSLGCPYAIRDYRAVNPEYGTLEDFRALVDAIHQRGMKCIIDVVYNHTSPDSRLVAEHPDYFYRKPDGRMGTKTGDWTDVADLDYNNKELWKYQIETLCQWAQVVDGFRCDVASLVPLDFWLQARQAVEQVRPGCLWLAESVEAGFIAENRRGGHTAHSDGELYQAFDITYDYDVNSTFLAYLDGRCTLADYLARLILQDTMYPANYVKLRFLENHDQTRAKFKFPNESELKNWTAFLYFQKGTALLYGGQETENAVTPSLFDVDKVDWHTGKDLTPLMQKLYQIKQLPILAQGAYSLRQDEAGQTIIGCYEAAEETLIGIFCTHSRPMLPVQLDVLSVPDGRYVDLISGEELTVQDGVLLTDGKPHIFQVKKEAAQ